MISRFSECARYSRDMLSIKISTKLLLLLLLITIKISISKSSDVINEYFRRLLNGFVESDDGDRFLSMEIF